MTFDDVIALYPWMETFRADLRQDCRRVRWHVPCERDDVGARADLNRAAVLVHRGRAERN